MKLHKLVLGMLGTNCYILAEEESGKAIVVDAPDQADAVLELLRENGYTVQEIILTHAHFDHIMALAELKKRTGAPVLLHTEDVPLLRDARLNLAQDFGYEWNEVKYDRLLNDGDEISLGKEKIRILHTPGHTAGCICLLTGDVLLSGDTLFRRSVGRVDHPSGNLEQEIRSIRTKLLTLPDSVKVYPGHGSGTTIGEERRENPYLQ